MSARGGAPVQHLQRARRVPTLTKCSSSSSASIGQMRPTNQRSSGRSSRTAQEGHGAVPVRVDQAGRDNVIWQVHVRSDRLPCCDLVGRTNRDDEPSSSTRTPPSKRTATLGALVWKVG